ncbi:tryptophan 2,3-dioxygenase [Woodsholea maritima]|uniref:tryptophan 2,3-dioxygenase n=1 Tax=Woodsholea maritima TaxID=240237 RepID=UPI0003749D26|nr:tryptophan 2,3-dioxygenase family protein [Woodsholea maritima]
MREPVDTHIDVSDEDIHWQPDAGLSYGKYLALDTILDVQHPLSDEHDEMLFIIIHQASELWLKLCLHELNGAFAFLEADNDRAAMKNLARIARIQEQLTQSWSVLATMTPADYMKFRGSLGQSSGFQSFQYRILEYKLGNKSAPLAEVHKPEPEVYAAVKAALHQPSLWDAFLAYAHRQGLTMPDEVLNRDWSQPYSANETVEAQLKLVYQGTKEWWAIYELAEKLVDLEHKFQQWRFNHMKTVERIIGFRRGTGGSGGVSYLVKALNLRFFPELWTVRTRL